jgi:hypothetical protein
LPDGRVLVTGGWGGRPSAEIWDPATSSFDPAGSLGEARSNHTATLLPDGQILVVGGWDGDKPIASAEIWGTSTN